MTQDDKVDLLKQIIAMTIWEVGNVTPYDKGFADGANKVAEIISNFPTKEG